MRKRRKSAAEICLALAGMSNAFSRKPVNAGPVLTETEIAALCGGKKAKRRLRRQRLTQPTDDVA